MTESDIQEGQRLVTDMVEILGKQRALQEQMQDVVLGYQTFLVGHITGERPG